VTGSSSPRSSRLTWVRSMPATIASAPWETSGATRGRLTLHATSVRASMHHGDQFAAH
jgi:hypothetical protein